MADIREAMKNAGFNDKPQNRTGDRRGQPGRRHGEQVAMPKLPDTYIFIDGQGRRCLSRAFVAKENIDAMAKLFARNRLTNSQMRRFFNHCREVERRVRVDGESWAHVAAKFEMLSSHAQYARSAGNIPDEFQSFIDSNVNRVVSNENPEQAFLEGFLPHFEALVGFSAAHLK